eukprot:scaffold31397_cov31-Tisochrysis_lutea.AAC.4
MAVIRVSFGMLVLAPKTLYSGIAGLFHGCEQRACPCTSEIAERLEADAVTKKLRLSSVLAPHCGCNRNLRNGLSIRHSSDSTFHGLDIVRNFKNERIDCYDPTRLEDSMCLPRVVESTHRPCSLSRSSSLPLLSSLREKPAVMPSCVTVAVSASRELRWNAFKRFS